MNRLYAQPDCGNGKALSLQDTENIFERMPHYPNYKSYIAKYEDHSVGTYALLIMANLRHEGTPSAIIEDATPSSLGFRVKIKKKR